MTGSSGDNCVWRSGSHVRSGGSTHMGTGPRPLLIVLFRMIPWFPPTLDARECATHPPPPVHEGHEDAGRAPPGRPAHTTPNPENHHTPHTHPVPGALTHHNPNTKPDRSRRGERPISNRKRTDLGTGYDRSRAGERPISNRKRTDLGTGYDRSRAGEQPISTRNRTDLGGVRLAGLTSPGGPCRDDVAPCLKRGRGRRVGASQPALPGRESAARQGRTAYGMMSA